ncbi:cytochrome P450 94C1-like [Lycium ferocissimum]|uniref:cytochrome P450 94C1-like n=1 Tax=Lycium ferocissimum TaxID=112874 RepID=UPI002815CE05|nr:cytochrome P450 94C1-like [Lycium ferocissimum]
MESQVYTLLQYLQVSIGYFLFSFAIAFSFFSVLLFLKNKLWCNCDICHCYLTSSWRKEFTNLGDWYAHLLRNSPSQTIQIHVLGNIITANPRNVEYMLKTNFLNYPKGKPFSMILGDLLGDGIFNVDGDLWMFQRKMASLELGSMSIRSYAFNNVKNEIKFRLLPLLSSVVSQQDLGGTTLDLQDVFRRFSFDNICKFSFGLDPGCLELSLPLSHFAQSFDLATKLSAERAMAASPLIWKIKRLLNIGNEKKLRKAIENIDVLAREVIRQKRKLECSNHQDLLSRFMTMVDNEVYLRDIVISFILAGRDTVASALTSIFWLLTSHPDVELRIREETSCVMQQNQEFLKFEQINQMHYLNAVVHESMRLYPPVQFDSKFASENDVFPDGTFVGKNDRVTYHAYAMGRMETIWGHDYMEFKPERWLKNGIFCQESPFKYPVFQGGIRVCLGKELALTEMKCVVASMLQHFDIRAVAAGGDLRFDPGLTATVRGGLPVVVRRRRGF